MVVVLAVKGFAERAAAHVSEKIFKFQPALANLNAAAAVTRVSRIIWIAATRVHSGPTFVYLGLRLAVRRMPFTVDFAMPASARLRVTGLQVIAINLDNCSAVTFASPNNAAFFDPPSWAEYNKAAKTLSGDVDKFSRHGDLHVGLPMKWRWSVYRRSTAAHLRRIVQCPRAR
jgi:hypothetical protein